MAMDLVSKIKNQDTSKMSDTTRDMTTIESDDKNYYDNGENYDFSDMGEFPDLRQRKGTL